MSPVRILVVDDEPMILAAVRNMLTVAGYEVWTAGDGTAALEFIRQQAVDVVLTDVVMPAVSGLEVIVSLNETHPHVRVIAMSGYSEALPAVLSFVGTANVLMKPFGFRELMDVLQGKNDPAGERQTCLDQDPAAESFAGSAGRPVGRS